MPEPAPHGELLFAFDLPPVSQQAKGEAREGFQKAVRERTAAVDFLLSGDVSVAVEWAVSEQARYETDRAPDVDNILKPLLDALTGPAGILIDDNQVQHVSCHWVDSYSGEESLAIRVRHSPDEWVKKGGLFFVQLAGGLCVPLSKNTPREFQKTVLEIYVKALALRNEALKKGLDYYTASACMPIQRVFHRTRLGAFEVISQEAFDAAGAAN